MKKSIWLGLALVLSTFLIHAMIGFRSIVFVQDTARDVVLAKQAIERGEWLVGYGAKTSVGNFHLPPLYYQLHVVLTYLFPENPLVMMWFVLIVEAFTPLLLWLLLRRFLTESVAYGTAVSYALFYLVILFSTQAWNPNIIPFCVVATVFSWYVAYVDRKKWAVFLGCLAPAIAANMHFQAFLLLPILGLGVIFVWWRHRALRLTILVAIGLAFIMFWPYFFAEARGDWRNTRSMISFFTQEHSNYYDRVSKPDYVLTFLPSFYERLVIGRELPFHWFGRLLLWGGLCSLALIAYRHPRQRLLLFWLLWYIGTSLIGMRLYKGDKLDYYLLTLFPSSAFLLGALLFFIPKRVAWVSILIFCAIVFTSSRQISQIKPSNSLQTTKDIAEFLTLKLPEGNARFVFHNLQFVNVIAYAMKEYTPVTHDLNSRYIVDVCGSGDGHCEWVNERKCSTSPITDFELAMYLDAIHYNKGYERIESKEFPGVAKIVIGKVASEAGKLEHPGVKKTVNTGNDYLITTF